MDDISLEKVFEPAQIGTMTLKNRLVMPPMVTNYCEENGAVTERFIAYHTARAKGGVGMIIIEASFVMPTGKGFSHEAGIDNDKRIPGLKSLTDAVHVYGTKMAVQLYHGGRQTHEALLGTAPVAPSPIPCPVCQDMPKELTVKEIADIVKAFGEAAKRAREAGFDAVEIHGAHGYLLDQFLSAYSNKRTDEYGGKFENRMRFPLEVVDHVRNVVGADYPVIYRLSSEEFVEGGLSIDDTKAFSRVLVAHGIDAIHVSGGVYESAAMIIQPAAIPQGCYIGNAAAIKEAIHGEIPVMVVGRIKDPIMAEKIIEEGKADFVVMGRPLLADPELPNKAKEGRLSEIRKCIACNQGCIDRLFADLDIGCLVNAMAGHELEYTFLKPAKKKKVVIVGAGPAGLETARVAAIRGHDVTLYEEKGELGGQLPIASVPPGKDEISDFTTFLIDAVKRLDVKIHTKTKADISMILKDAPDAVIIATGSKPIMPDIPGAKLCKVVSAHDVLEGKVDTGKNVVIIGGGAAGCETADYLAGDGMSVTVVEMLDDIATDTGMLVRALLLNRLGEQDVRVMTQSKVVEIVSGGVIIDKDGRTEKIDDVDTIVFAVGAKSENALANALKQKGILMTMIGDCVEPGKIMDAVEEGFSVAYHL